MLHIFLLLYFALHLTLYLLFISHGHDYSLDLKKKKRLDPHEQNKAKAKLTNIK